MGTFIPLAYRTSVDHVLNQGFRAWNVIAFNGTYQAVPYNQVLINSNETYNNVEQYLNNDEVCLLDNIDNNTLLSGAPSNAS